MGSVRIGKIILNPDLMFFKARCTLGPVQVSGGHCGSGFNGPEGNQTAVIQLRFFCRAPTSSCDSGKHWNPISIPMIEKPRKHTDVPLGFLTICFNVFRKLKCNVNIFPIAPQQSSTLTCHNERRHDADSQRCSFVDESFRQEVSQCQDKCP